MREKIYRLHHHQNQNEQQGHGDWRRRSKTTVRLGFNSLTDLWYVIEPKVLE
ncbi:hypothetical protein HYC85_017106 [Camellia sinensis]|uniref:Uncharacterized protein n=1 Tax=Camellia sinensis TaxID=4442 RepID=A0A7J7H573_CAMSI|nr:hypothetical protein HYC85_017106 [Camellia sinensis]